MIRKPQQQIEHMEQARVRNGWNSRRPEEIIEQELADEPKRSVRRPK